MGTDRLPTDALTEAIIGAAITVHQATGPGLLESVYKQCMVIELRENGLKVQTERPLEFVYRGVQIEPNFRLDMVVEDTVLVEIKSVESIVPVHQAQVITYLKLTDCPIGLLFNFNVPVLRHGMRRLLHPDLYRQTKGVLATSVLPSSFPPVPIEGV